PSTSHLSTPSLHDALPIYMRQALFPRDGARLEADLADDRVGRIGTQCEDRLVVDEEKVGGGHRRELRARRTDNEIAGAPGSQFTDRKSTRLNSSHVAISYA